MFKKFFKPLVNCVNFIIHLAVYCAEFCYASTIAMVAFYIKGVSTTITNRTNRFKK